MQRVLLLLFVTAATMAAAVISAPAQRVSRVALVIGNADYSASDQRLQQAIQSARATAQELQRNGFDVELQENLTKEGMQRATDRLYERIKPGSVALIFFSGYGLQTEKNNYLIPVDARITNESEVRLYGFGLEAMLTEMTAKGALVKIAIIDAARSNPFESHFRRESAGLAPVSVPPGTLVILSNAPNKVIADSDVNNDLFVRELIRQMHGMTFPSATLEERFHRTRAIVGHASNGAQEPWVASSIEDSHDLRLAWPARDQIAASPPTTARPAPAPTQSPSPSTQQPPIPSSTKLAESLGEKLRTLPAKYNRPEALFLGSSTSVELVIDTAGYGVDEMLRGLRGEIRTATVRMAINTNASAYLTGPKDMVEIALRGDPLRTVTEDAPVSWIWDVRPLKPGQVQVVLEVFSHVKIGDSEGRAQIRVFQDTWNMEAKGLEWVKYQVAEIQPMWAFLCAVISAVAGTFAFFGIKGWKTAKPRAEDI
jgi:Caspase domain